MMDATKRAQETQNDVRSFAQFTELESPGENFVHVKMKHFPQKTLFFKCFNLISSTLTSKITGGTIF